MLDKANLMSKIKLHRNIVRQEFLMIIQIIKQ